MMESEISNQQGIMEKELSEALQQGGCEEKQRKKTLYLEKEVTKNRKFDGGEERYEEQDACDEEDFCQSSLTTKDSSYQSLVSGVDEGGGAGGGDLKKEKRYRPFSQADLSHEQQKRQDEAALSLLTETESLLSLCHHGSESGVYTPEEPRLIGLVKTPPEKTSPLRSSPCSSSSSLSREPTFYEELALRKSTHFMLRIVHFNDVYNPLPTLHQSGALIGGAPSFCTAVKQKKEGNKGLVLFSGDIFSPSQISEMTKGRQMADLLNLLGVHTACYGNHDLDYGWEWLEVLAGTTNCKWIMSNTWGRQEEGEQRGCCACNAGGVLANAQRYRIFEWGGGGDEEEEEKETRRDATHHQGRTRGEGEEKDGDESTKKEDERRGGEGGGGMIDQEKKKKKHERILIGIMGLIEEEWIDTLNPHDRDHIVYRDFVAIAKEMCEFFKRRGCDLIIALTHMRWNNDEKLAREVPDLDLILGGHDHEYTTKIINGVPIIKSGSDFREFSSITLYPAFQLREKGTAHMVPPRKAKEEGEQKQQESKKEEHPFASLSRDTPSGNDSSSSSSADDEDGDETTGWTYTSESSERKEEAFLSPSSTRGHRNFSNAPASSTTASSILRQPSSSHSPGSTSLEQGKEKETRKNMNDVKSSPRRCRRPSDLLFASLSESSSLLRESPFLSLANFETSDEKEEPKKFYRAGRWYVSCERVDVNKSMSRRSGDDVLKEEPQGAGVDLSAKFPSLACVEPDEEVFRMLSRYQSEYSLPENEVLGVFPVPLETRFSLVRREECNSGNWLTDIMREAFQTDVALYNSGGIRSDCLFNKGEMITSETLNALLSGLRQLCIIDVQGSLFKSILENSVSRYPQLEGRFLQVSGLRFTFKPSECVGHRVIQEDISIFDRRRKEWMKVEENRLYSVILPRFLVGGGDGFTVFSSCRERPLKGDEEKMNKFLDLSILTQFWLRYTNSHASCHGVHTPEERQRRGEKGREEEEEEEEGQKRELTKVVDGYPSLSRNSRSSPSTLEEKKKKKKSERESSCQDFFSFDWVHRVRIEEKQPDQWRIRKLE